MSLTEFEFVNYERDGEIAVITMNDRKRLNSWTFEMSRDMNKAFDVFAEDDEAKVGILTSAGEMFCSGVDMTPTLKMTDEERQKNALERRRISRLGAYQHRDSIPKPIICAVQGDAYGMGWFVAMGGDLVVAAESAIFWQAEPFVGYQGCGIAISTYMVPFHLGVEVTLGFKMTAQRCYEIGLVNRVVPDDRVMPVAKEMAEHICGLAPLALRYLIAACRNARISNLVPSSTALPHFQEYEVLGKTEDVREGYAAIREHRKPVWKGR
jgi:enoyl-CoA hydratase/carnithine racemase